MRIAFRILCCSSLILAALACGGDSDAPCSPADAAAGRCQAPPAAPASLPPGSVLPDWALQLCRDWRRADGSCDQMQVMADYEQCLSQYGVPEQERMLALGVGNRAVQRARDRATYLCLEQRRWIMDEEAQRRWIGRPQKPAR